MTKVLKTYLLPLGLLLLLTFPGQGHANRSVFEDGLLSIPRVDIEGFGARELVLRLVSSSELTLSLDQFNPASLSVANAGEFDISQLTLDIYEVELVGTDQVYFLQLQLISQSPQVLFKVTTAELLPPDIEPPDDTPTEINTLFANQQLQVNDSLESANGLFRLRLQADGNLVFTNTETNEPLWYTGTQNSNAAFLLLQGGDGNLVLYTQSIDPVWSSGTTGGLGATRLTVLNNGALALFDGDNEVWAVNETGSVGNSLLSGERIDSGQWLQSSNNQFRLELQRDNNLVLFHIESGAVVWDTGTDGDEYSTLLLQGDSNLVMFTASGNLLWTPGTNGTGANRLTLNDNGSLALYENDDVVWAVNGSGDSTDNVDTGGSGGDNGGGLLTGDPYTAIASTGRFSAPSAALYALNDASQRAFPQHIRTPFFGNGHAETWDGRIFVVTKDLDWYASVFRPERIGYGRDSQLSFYSGAFGTNIPLELASDNEDVMHNWLAITPDPQAPTENPYPSDAQGNLQPTGTYRTYKAIVYHTSKRGEDDTHVDNDQMGLRRATFIVSDANTMNAQLVSAEFTSEFSPLVVGDDSDFRCIEPSVTMDSRLLVCQGHPDNDGTIDNLVYSWTELPGSPLGWTDPKSVANIYFDDREVVIDGIPFETRYPIAQNPITDANGMAYQADELIKGAYPWISHDGAELFYQASHESASGRRTGTSVFGRWTGWGVRHIDGPINRDRYETLRLFLSSPGAYTTMWSPYKDVNNLAMPYSIRGPGYSLFGSNSEDYMEVSFDDFLDGNYVLYLGMNEQINRAGLYQVTTSNDTSGNFNNATLIGAQFPFEFNGNDELVGLYGQAIYFPPGAHLEVDRNNGWDTLQSSFTIEMFVKILTSAEEEVQWLNMQNGISLGMDENGLVTAMVTDIDGLTAEITGPFISSDTWVHIALSFDAESQSLALHIDGIEVANQIAADLADVNYSGSVTIGDENNAGLMILDEVKISNVARRSYEIGYSANVRFNRPPNQELVSTIPEHLQSLSRNTTSVDRFSQVAADLGADLFTDVLLSKERTTACANCHVAALSFTDGRIIAQGNEPTDAGTRNSPMLINRLFSSLQGWSGISASMDTQALFPIAAPHEMNLPIPEAVQRLAADEDYANRFQSIYGEPVNATNLAAALASFQVTQFTPRNRVDDFKDGNLVVLTDAEQRGLVLFEGKARCSGCHAGSNFTDESFRNNGLTFNDDIGRAEVTGRSRDFRLFKTPSLRLVSETAPYMHDGSLSSLRDVVEQYNGGAVGTEMIDTDIRPLELDNDEIDDLVAFLEAL